MALTTYQYNKSIDRFIRASGFLFLIFGLLTVVLRITQFFILGDPPLEQLVVADPFLLLQGIPSLAAAIFFLLGTAALHLRQAHRTGTVGLVVLIIAFSGLTLSTGAMWTYGFTAPELAREAPSLLTSPTSGVIHAVLVSMVIGQVGWLLMAIMALWANVIPRWASLTAIVSILLVVVLTPFSQTQLLRLVYNARLGLGPLAVGYVLWRGHGNVPSG